MQRGAKMATDAQIVVPYHIEDSPPGLVKRKSAELDESNGNCITAEA